MEHTTAESFLHALATKGGVIVSSGDMPRLLVSMAQVHTDWYVLPNGMGFGRLDKWDHPNQLVPRLDITDVSPVMCQGAPHV